MSSTDWQAAMVVLDHPLFHGRVESFCDDTREVIRPSILREGWSDGERRLIELAMSFTSPRLKVNLYDALSGLSPVHGHRVLDAIAIAAGVDREAAHSVCRARGLEREL